MTRYKNDAKEFKADLERITANSSFVDYVIAAIETKKKLNYCDELPRYVLEDACIDGEILTLICDNGENKEIDFSKVTVNQYNSARTKFDLTEKGGSDYKTIIFNC